VGILLGIKTPGDDSGWKQAGMLSGGSRIFQRGVPFWFIAGSIFIVSIPCYLFCYFI